MAESQQSNALAAAFPSPPQFYQHFTPENIERIADLRTAQSSQLSSSTIVPNIAGGTSKPGELVQLLDLPSELRFLQPPNPPADGIYKSFGSTYNLNEVLPSLADQDIEQLYTPPSTPPEPGNSSTSTTHKQFDRALILKRLAKSLLLNFLELMGIMSVNPEHHADKIMDLRTLFINFHHLLNEYRPHQARESLIMMMEEQLRRSKAEIEGVERMKEKVEVLLKGLGDNKDEMSEIVPEGKTEKLDADDVAGKATWDELERAFG